MEMSEAELQMCLDTETGMTGQYIAQQSDVHAIFQPDQVRH